MFLDIKVILRNSKVFKDMYIKSTDCDQYLHYLSARPYHNKKSVVRLCDLADYEVWRISKIIKIISSDMRKAKFSD